MNGPSLWLIVVVGANVALTMVLLLRTSKTWRRNGHAVEDELRANREESRTAAKDLREELAAGLRASYQTLSGTIASQGNAQHAQLESMSKRLSENAEASQGVLERIRGSLDSRAKELQDGNEKKLSEMRKGVSDSIEGMTRQLKEFTTSNQIALENVRTTVDSRVRELQVGNESKLEEMRKTVDEKLHESLERRLGESFKLVSERLEAVHKGLGEMQHLAAGVGDLKRVLTNVKTRGTWAEVQLGAILEQILTPQQYQKNVRVKPESSEAVEYAVRLPGPRAEPGVCVWLPIDSKFPQEDYLRLQAAAEGGDPVAVQSASEALARTVRVAAKDVYDKYVSPPHTTDFGIVFLATEGLYAEVLRHPGLGDELLHRYRVVVAGPTTLAAILSSLRMGFQTLAIEQRAAEVWRVLGAVKTEFGKFGEVLTKVKRQLETASRSIEDAGVRSRAMERKLRAVEQLPEEEATRILTLPDAGLEVEEPSGERPLVDDEIPF